MERSITAIMLTAYYLHAAFFARNIIMYMNCKYIVKRKLGNKQKSVKNSARQPYKDLKLKAPCVSM